MPQCYDARGKYWRQEIVERSRALASLVGGLGSAKDQFEGSEVVCRIREAGTSVAPPRKEESIRTQEKDHTPNPR